MRNTLYIKKVLNWHRLVHLTDEYPLIWFYVISVSDALGVAASRATSEQKTLILNGVNARLKLNPVAK